MTLAFMRTAWPAAALVVIGLGTPALAQRPPAPEQQIFALQQQLAAARATVIRLDQRLMAIERQLQQMINSSETSAHRIAQLEAALQQLRSEQESRIAALERGAAAGAPPAAAARSPDAAPTEVAAPPAEQPAARTAARPEAEASADPGEDAYSEGFRLWEQRRYDAAIASLRAFTSAFPRHRRVSWANNLVGRALLDKGEPRAAAEVLLANYRSNPKGGRAQDSLYYLGRALMKLGQPEQACKAYAELTSVYAGAVRAELQPLVANARSEANCS